MPDKSDIQDQRSSGSGAWIGAGVAAAAIGAAFIWGRKAVQGSDSDELVSDAPPHVLRGEAAKRTRPSSMKKLMTLPLGWAPSESATVSTPSGTSGSSSAMRAALVLRR